MSDLTEYFTTLNGHELTVQLTDDDARAMGLLDVAEEIDVEAEIETRVNERVAEIEAEFETRVAEAVKAKLAEAADEAKAADAAKVAETAKTAKK